MSIKWLNTVSFVALKPQMILAVIRINEIYSTLGVDCWITSGSDGKHKIGSFHYNGDALDFRTFILSLLQQQDLLDKVTSALGPEFDVILEKDHLHVEYDPK